VTDCGDDDTPVDPETVDPETPTPEKEKWYEKKPVVITVTVVASFATIAILMLIW
jgi:hypothetical protein